MLLLLVCFTVKIICLVLTKEEHIVTQDGVSLYNVLYYEALKKSGDTILVRTPYGINSHTKTYEDFAKKGKFVLGQDVRGTGKSKGIFMGFNFTGSDEKDTITWLKKQSWFNGKVYTFGASALAITQYLGDPSFPNEFTKGQCAHVGTGYMYDTIFQGGAYREQMAEKWLAKFGEVVSEFLIMFLLSNEAYKPNVWHNMEIENFIENVKWPSVHIGGWYDVFGGFTIKTFNQYKRIQGKDTYLVMEPEGHCTGKSSIKFPNSTLDYVSLCNKVYEESNFPDNYINFYVMGPNSISYGSKGGNYWTEYTNWPEIQEVSLYISEKGGLSFNQPTTDFNTSFSYNPEYPTPTIGGNNLPNLGLSCGAQDQTPNEKREDNILFTTDVFDDHFAITGNLSMILRVSSDRNDTDFVVRVTDVYPTGESILLRDGVIRMRWRDGKKEPSLMIPGVIYDVSVDLWYISYIMNPGHKLRVAITSSNYPRYSPNRNNGNLELEKGMKYTANNIIYSKSKLILPKVDLEDLEKHRI